MSDKIKMLVIPSDREGGIGKFRSIDPHVLIANKYRDEFDKMINRLSFSLIIAGMIVGSSIIINSNPGPKIHGISIIGVVGYIVSAILGLWLLISIIRSGSLK